MPSLIFRRRIWHQKPPVGVRLNPAHPLTASLRGVWLFNEQGGSVVQNPVNPNFNGTITTAAWTSSQNGYGLSFNGTSGYVNCGRGAYVDNLDPFGVEALVYLNGTGEGAGGRVWTKQSGSLQNRCGYDSGTTADNFNYLRSRATTLMALNSNTSTFVPGSWYHVAATFDTAAGVAQLFINGVEPAYFQQVVGAGALSDDSGNDILIGNRSTDDRTFDGTIIFSRIYNKLLTARDVADLYANPYAMFQPIRRRML